MFYFKTCQNNLDAFIENSTIHYQYQMCTVMEHVLNYSIYQDCGYEFNSLSYHVDLVLLIYAPGWF